MKIKNFLLVAALATGVAFFSSCEKETLLDTNTPTEEILLEGDLADAPVIDNSENEVQLVALIKKNGHEFYFEAIGEEDVVIREKMAYSEDGVVSFLETFSDESTPFDMFIALTEASVPVPISIANTAEQSVVAKSNREIDASNTLFASDDNSTNIVEDRGCYDEGYSGFRSNRCGITSSTASDIRFCDNGTWTSHTRNSVFGGSWKTCKKVQTWTNVICGLTTVRYEYFNSGAWHLYYSAQLQNGIWNIVRHSSSAKYRRVKRSANGGSFRAYTRFYN